MNPWSCPHLQKPQCHKRLRGREKRSIHVIVEGFVSPHSSTGLASYICRGWELSYDAGRAAEKRERKMLDLIVTLDGFFLMDLGEMLLFLSSLEPGVPNGDEHLAPFFLYATPRGNNPVLAAGVGSLPCSESTRWRTVTGPFDIAGLEASNLVPCQTLL